MRDAGGDFDAAAKLLKVAVQDDAALLWELMAGRRESLARRFLEETRAAMAQRNAGGMGHRGCDALSSFAHPDRQPLRTAPADARGGAIKALSPVHKAPRPTNTETPVMPGRGGQVRCDARMSAASPHYIGGNADADGQGQSSPDAHAHCAFPSAPIHETPRETAAASGRMEDAAQWSRAARPNSETPPANRAAGGGHSIYGTRPMVASPTPHPERGGRYPDGAQNSHASASRDTNAGRGGRSGHATQHPLASPPARPIVPLLPTRKRPADSILDTLTLATGKAIGNAGREELTSEQMRARREIIADRTVKAVAELCIPKVKGAQTVRETVSADDINAVISKERANA